MVFQILTNANLALTTATNKQRATTQKGHIRVLVTQVGLGMALFVKVLLSNYIFFIFSFYCSFLLITDAKRVLMLQM